MKRYYSLYQEEKKADIYIYGDITSWPWYEDEVSSYTLSKELQELGDVEEINIFINSYGGEVAEGLAIYNALKRHNAKINTYVDGFACSIASVIFMAGDNRYMSDTSLLMIHNAWTYTHGNAEELKKQAEDLEKITQASINAYMKHLNIEEEELKELMDNETWLNSTDAIEKGFASELIEADNSLVANQSIRNKVSQKLTQGSIAQVSVSLEKDDIKEVIAEQLDKFKQELVKEETEEDENKVLNFMQKFVKGEE